MQDARRFEIDNNYDYFQRNLQDFLEQRRGQFALLRHARVVSWHAGPGEAYRAGLKEFPDRLFSVQEADDRPAEIGLMSLAIN